MRIAFVTTEYVTESSYDGGLANYLYRVCIELSKLGHEPIIIVSADSDNVFKHNNILVYRVCVVNKWLNLFNKLTRHHLKETASRLWISWKLNKVIRVIHRKSEIDIIQYANHFATGLFRPKKIVTIIRLSSFQPLWNKAYEISRSTDTIITEYLDLFALKKADGVFGPSRKVALAVEEVLGRSVKILETPIFIETKNLDTRPYNDLLQNKKYLLFFGSIGLLKGVKTIAEIINPFLEKHPDFFFVFIGQDLFYQEKPMMDYVWFKAGSHRGRVLYLGRMQHAQLYPIIQNAYAVILPSRIDNLPNVCLEAMALKKIVVGTKNTSMEELIVDDFNGFLSKVDDSEDLLRKIEQVIHLDDNELKRFSENAYCKSIRFVPQAVIPKLIIYYNDIMKSG